MPSTINGVGTHYYGKSNLRTRQGQCEQCNAFVELSSYDTRLWFVVIFIPVIPLGKRRVIDSCPRCTRHGVMKLTEWEAKRRDAMQEALQKVVQEPNNAQAVMDLDGTCLVFGEWEKADQLEARMEKDFPNDAKVFLHLASAHGYRGRADEALRCLARAKELDPSLAETVPVTPGPVPKGGGLRGKLIAFFAVLAIGFGILVAADRYKAAHRELHIINGYPGLVQVRIPGVGEQNVAALSRTVLTLPEGTHTAHVSGPVTAEYPFTIASSFVARLFDDRVFVLNPGGAAILVRQDAIYVTKGTTPPTSKGTTILHFGTPFGAFANIDYAFEEFPHEISLGSDKERRKWRLQHFTQSVLGLFHWLLSEDRVKDAMALAEWAMDLGHPEHEDIMSAYAGLADLPDHHARVLQGLQARTRHRPVDILLHRTYQDVFGRKEYTTLLAEYDAFLAAEPGNSALLYLRGRLSSSIKEGTGYFQRAIEADPKNAYSLFGMGYAHMAQGSWEKALPLLEQTCALDSQNILFRRALLEARMGAGQHDALLRELREEVTQSQYAPGLPLFWLVGAAALRGNRDEALQLCDEFNRTHQGADPEGAAQVNSMLRCFALYAAGDFAALETETADNEELLEYRIQALTELGRLDEAAELAPDGGNDPTTALTRSIAWELKGDKAKASALRKTAADLLRQERPDLAGAADMLVATQAPSLDAALDVDALVAFKAIFLTALVQAFPNADPEWRARARALNAHYIFPHHLLARALAAPSKR